MCDTCPALLIRLDFMSWIIYFIIIIIIIIIIQPLG